MWIKSLGWKKSNTASDTANRLDALGAATEILGSFGMDLRLEHIQLLLAISVLSGKKEWVALRDAKNKMPMSSDYQFTRYLKHLSGKAGVLGFFEKNSPLIEVRYSAESAREKEARLSSFGNLIIHRTLQTLDAASPCSSNEITSSAPTDCMLLLEGSAPGFKVSVTGEKVTHKVPLLISTGGNGSGVRTNTLTFAHQAIAQGAIVHWFNFNGDLQPAISLYATADQQYRSHAFFVNGTRTHKDAPISEVFHRSGICVHQLGGMEKIGSKERFAKILDELVLATENSNSRAGDPVLVVFDAIPSLKDFNFPAVERLVKAGALIHIVENGYSDAKYTDYDKLGFQHALFKVENPGGLAVRFDTTTDTIKDTRLGEGILRNTAGEINHINRIAYHETAIPENSRLANDIL
jgi:hypothetical protein